jgi:hypothetical protein
MDLTGITTQDHANAITAERDRQIASAARARMHQDLVARVAPGAKRRWPVVILSAAKNLRRSPAA